MTETWFLPTDWFEHHVIQGLKKKKEKGADPCRQKPVRRWVIQKRTAELDLAGKCLPCLSQIPFNMDEISCDVFLTKLDPFKVHVSLHSGSWSRRWREYLDTVGEEKKEIWVKGQWKHTQRQKFSQKFAGLTFRQSQQLLVTLWLNPGIYKSPGCLGFPCIWKTSGVVKRK